MISIIDKETVTIVKDKKGKHRRLFLVGSVPMIIILN